MANNELPETLDPKYWAKTEDGYLLKPTPIEQLPEREKTVLIGGLILNADVVLAMDIHGTKTPADIEPMLRGYYTLLAYEDWLKNGAAVGLAGYSIPRLKEFEKNILNAPRGIFRNN